MGCVEWDLLMPSSSPLARAPPSGIRHSRRAADYGSVQPVRGYAKLLPAGRSARILGLPNRLAIALGLSLVSVAVELYLHASGTFHWEYWWWNTPFVPLIVVFGYLWFYLFAAWVYDAPSSRQRWRRVGSLAALDLIMGLVFGVGLGWL